MSTWIWALRPSCSFGVEILACIMEPSIFGESPALYLGFTFGTVFWLPVESLSISLVLLRFREILPGGTDAHESIYQKNCACGTYEEDSTRGKNEGADDSTGGHSSAYIDHDLPVPHGAGPIDRGSARLFLNGCFFSESGPE